MKLKLIIISFFFLMSSMANANFSKSSCVYLASKIILNNDKPTRPSKVTPMMVGTLDGSDAPRLLVSTSLHKEAMLDTGGGASLINYEDIKGYNPRALTGPNSSITIPTMQGQIKAKRYIFDEFTINQKVFHDFEVLVSRDFSKSSSPLIGKNAIENQILGLNFKEGKLTWFNSFPSKQLNNELFMINSWYCLNIRMVNGKILKAGFDTGAPVSLLDKSVFDKYKRHFEILNKFEDGTIRARVITPFSISEIQLEDNVVMIVDFKNSIGDNSPDMFLGLNEIQYKNWIIDFKKLKYSLTNFE